MFIRLLSVVSQFVLVFPSAFAASNIWEDLRHGGHVILIRHTSTDRFTPSIDSDADFDGCATQRNLSPQGRGDATRIGRVLRAKRVPIGEVLSGPSCRTQDTARLAFKQYKIWDELDLLSDFSEEEAIQRTARMNEKIINYRGRKNWVWVTHQQNIDALIFELVDPGMIVILKPEGDNFRVLAKLPLNDPRLSR